MIQSLLENRLTNRQSTKKIDRETDIQPSIPKNSNQVKREKGKNPNRYEQVTNKQQRRHIMTHVELPLLILEIEVQF